MRKLLWLPPALRDLRELHLFIKKENPRAALKAIRKIKASTAMLKDFPDMGVKLPEDGRYREFHIPFGHGAYVVRYRTELSQKIVISRVWHSREDRTH